MPRHTTPVKKLASGRWQIRYRDPSGAQRKETFATSREAHNRLAATRSDISRGAYVDPVDGAETFGEPSPRRWAAGRDWKATSRESWEAVSRRLEPLDRLPLLAVDRLCLEALQTALLERYARRTVELTMTMAKSVMKAAYATGSDRSGPHPRPRPAEGPGGRARRPGPSDRRPDQRRGARPPRRPPRPVTGPRSPSGSPVSVSARCWPCQPTGSTSSVDGCSSTASSSASGTRWCSPGPRPRRSARSRSRGPSSSNSVATSVTTRGPASSSGASEASS